ncbi:EscT/YscT/HrcT family type III secretion system export apparatus protein [Brucella anthropi]|uniref:EscT/YscT/HrcT family type III secretion system export apparatus protein n=1 Tax=Brucella anthropi TaxID=529 RepID=UPI00384D1338
MLSMARFLGFFAAIPVFSRRNMSRSARLSLIVGASAIVAPFIIEHSITTPITYGLYFALLVKEGTVGFVLGVILWAPIRSLEFTGALLDTQCGATQGQDYDVSADAQATPFMILFNRIFSTIFFVGGIYLMSLSALFESMIVWRPYQLAPSFLNDMMPIFRDAISGLFLIASIHAIPVAGFLFVTDIIVALIARSAQSLNALTFATPIKMALTIVALMFYLEYISLAVMSSLVNNIQFLMKRF